MSDTPKTKTVNFHFSFPKWPSDATTQILAAVLIVLASIGYIWNIVKLIAAWNDPLTLGILFRLVAAVVFPIAWVWGYL